MNFKRLTGLTLSGLLFLTGCSSNKKVDGKSVAASLDTGNILADTLYSNLSSSSNGQSALFSYVLDSLIDEQYPATSDMKKNAEDVVESIKSSYQSQYDEDKYEEQLQSDLENAGYKSIEDYQNRVVYTYQYAELMKKYVNDNYDAVIDDYYSYAQPRMVSIIKVSAADISNPTDDEKDKLKEVQDLLKEGKSFGSVAKSYSDDDDTASAKGSLGVVDTKTSTLSDTYGSDVSDAVSELTTGKTSKVITGTDGWYILYCDSSKKADIKKELKNVDINSPLISYDDKMVYLAFNTYKINYKDKTIKKTITEEVEENLKEREEERK